MSVRLNVGEEREEKGPSEWPMSCGVTLVLRPYDATVAYAAQWEAQTPKGVEPKGKDESDHDFRERVKRVLDQNDRGAWVVSYMTAYGARAITGWKGVLDKSGQEELPFSREAWELFLRSVPDAIREAEMILTAWEAKAREEIEEGNGSASDSAGTSESGVEKSAQGAETQDSAVQEGLRALPGDDATTGSMSRVA